MMLTTKNILLSWKMNVIFLDANFTHYIGSDKSEEVIKKAENVMATGVKMKDSCHIVCAEMMNEMISPPVTVALLSRGMECLVEAMGIVEAEYFIAAVQREKFDYTKWQREHFDNMDLKSFVNNAKTYAQSIGK